jgi:hypothetical protein
MTACIRRAALVAVSLLAAAAIQLVWYFLGTLAVHIAFLDGPVPRSPAAKALAYGLLFLPTAGAVVVGAVMLIRAFRRGRAC